MRSDDAVGFGVALLRADGADLAWHARPIVSAVAHSNRFPSTGRLQRIRQLSKTLDVIPSF